MKGLGAIWGDNVAARRAEKKFTQALLAALCGVEQQTISKIERGVMIPSDHLKVTICRALGTTPGELFEWPPLEDLAAAS